MTQTAQSATLAADRDAAEKYLSAMVKHRDMPAEQLVPVLADIAKGIRRDIVRTIQGAGLGHIGGDLSVTDILVAAYWAVMSVNPLEPEDPERDRFVLSKGHCAAALYSTLASAGFFPREALSTFAKPLSPLNGHPNRVKVPGVETNTGPLGHGFPVATGWPLAQGCADTITAPSS